MFISSGINSCRFSIFSATTFGLGRIFLPIEIHVKDTLNVYTHIFKHLSRERCVPASLCCSHQWQRMSQSPHHAMLEQTQYITSNSKGCWTVLGNWWKTHGIIRPVVVCLHGGVCMTRSVEWGHDNRGRTTCKVQKQIILTQLD